MLALCLALAPEAVAIVLSPPATTRAHTDTGNIAVDTANDNDCYGLGRDSARADRTVNDLATLDNSTDQLFEIALPGDGGFQLINNAYREPTRSTSTHPIRHVDDNKCMALQSLATAGTARVTTS